MLSERIKATQAKIAEVSKRRQQNRRGRNRRGTPTITLVGYTNAGKSTLFNSLTDAQVLAQDMLFATLDPTMRKIQVPGTGEVVLADTVGFVSLLPHTLVEAFKATLEEVIHSDLLLHVVDASDPLWRERMEQVQQVLDEIGAAELRQIVVLNKADLLQSEAQQMLAGAGCLISAQSQQGLDALVGQIGDVLGVVAPHQVILPACRWTQSSMVVSLWGGAKRNFA